MNAPASEICTPRRELGRTGFVATALGIGDLADRQIDRATLVATARRAIDAGLNLIDTAPGYEDGLSEQVVGEAVRPVRDRIFVISKIDHHDQPVAPQLDASLARMGLDHLDLMVMHGLSTLDGWDRAAAPGGAMHQLGDAIDAGRIRVRGISCHHPDVLMRAIPSGLCDVVMFPLGPFVDERYVTHVLPLAREHGVGTVCFKTFGAGKLLGDTRGYNQPLADRPRGKLSSGGDDRSTATLPRLSVDQCLHYTLTLDPDVTLLGLSFPNEQDAAFASFARFAPLDAAAMAAIRTAAAVAIKGKGPVWWNPPA